MAYLKAIVLIFYLLLGLCLLLILGGWWNPHTHLFKHTVQWWLKGILKILGVTIHVTGQMPEHSMDSSNRGYLFVGNHVSWLDIPVIGSLSRTNFLSKAEVAQWPLIGWLAKGSGTLFIKRGSGDARNVTHQITERIQAGHSVIFFPEGTSTDGQTIRPFYPKLFRVCEHTPVQFQPFVLKYRAHHPSDSERCPVAFIADDDFMTHLWNLLHCHRIEAEVHFTSTVRFQRETLNSQVAQLHHSLSTILNTMWHTPPTSLKSA